MFDLINSAFAQEAASAAAKQPSMLASVFPLLLIFTVFYFLIIRPQSKKIKEHQNMLQAISKGDQVVTSGGIFGEIVKVEEDKNLFVVQIADEVKIKIRRDAISEIINPQPTPAKKNA